MTYFAVGSGHLLTHKNFDRHFEVHIQCIFSVLYSFLRITECALRNVQLTHRNLHQGPRREEQVIQCNRNM